MCETRAHSIVSSGSFLSRIALDPHHHPKDRRHESAHEDDPKTAISQVHFFDAGEFQRQYPGQCYIVDMSQKKRVVFTFDERSFQSLEEIKENAKFDSLAVRGSLAVSRALQQQAKQGFTEVVVRPTSSMRESFNVNTQATTLALPVVVARRGRCSCLPGRARRNISSTARTDRPDV